MSLHMSTGYFTVTSFDSMSLFGSVIDHVRMSKPDILLNVAVFIILNQSINFMKPSAMLSKYSLF